MWLVFSWGGLVPLACRSEAESALGIVVGGALDGGGLGVPGFVLCVEVFEVGDAPAAAGAGAEAFGDE